MPSGTQIRVFTEIDSTNAEALRALGSGYTGPCWFMAASQNAGRGRLGRKWISDIGNLYASLLLPLGCATEVIPQLSFVAALGVHDAVSQMMGADGKSTRLALKWPNDVLLNAQKLAGILLETSSAGGRVKAAVIGIGLNLAHSPQIADKPSTSLAEHEIQLSPEQALTQIAICLDQRIGEWQQGRNFFKIREDWCARAYGIGAEYMVTRKNEQLYGIFEGIDSDGAFILRQQNGEARQISSGEVRPSHGIAS